MSNFNNLKVFVLLLLTFPAFNACSTTKPQTEEPFLVSEADFKQYPNVPEFFTYSNLNTPLVTYKKIIIEHPLISINAPNGWRFANPNFLKFIADTLYKEVTKSLKTDFKVVKTAGPETLRVRLVINNLTLPNHRVSIASKSAGLIPVGLNDTILEAYFEDSLTEDLFGGIRDQRIGHKSSLKFLHGFTSALYIQRSFGAWSKDLLAILQENFKPKDESDDNLNPIANSELSNEPVEVQIEKVEEDTQIEEQEPSGEQKEILQPDDIIEGRYEITPPPSEEVILPSSQEPSQPKLEENYIIEPSNEQIEIEPLPPVIENTPPAIEDFPPTTEEFVPQRAETPEYTPPPPPAPSFFSVASMGKNS